ncbi:hypothetical protein EAO76_15200 [Streptomyces sp. sk2.1]|nr:hypothetical protein EAO76_15200 [Streptomyces sp. sk2.1]
MGELGAHEGADVAVDEDLNGARARVGGAEAAAADTVLDQLRQPLAPLGLLAAGPVAQDGAVAAQVPGVDPQAAECAVPFSGREYEEMREPFDGGAPGPTGRYEDVQLGTDDLADRLCHQFVHHWEAVTHQSRTYAEALADPARCDALQPLGRGDRGGRVDRPDPAEEA